MSSANNIANMWYSHL